MNLPRLLIGGTHSGCGKTTVTSAVLQALVLRGIAPSAFKCGPDYIDPMFHTEVIGAPSRNLDLFLSARVRETLAQHGGNFAVIEGVMGFYDGVGGSTLEASSCDLANQTETPAVLVLNAKGMSLSAAAMVRGYLDFAPNTIKGVILNGVFKAMYPYYREIVEQNTGIHVYGFLPYCADAAIESRHLGLITAAEIEDLRERLQRLAALAEECIDLDGLTALAQTAPPLTAAPVTVQPVGHVRIAVARDRAFCFYYADNLDLLRACGAELIYFSPLADEVLPRCDGLYLGGGYPELYAEKLGQNRVSRQSVARAVRGGLPTVAECGGFLYLQETLEGHPMAGVLPGGSTLGTRLRHFGYITLTARRDTLLCAAGETMRAHEFHYAASDDEGDACVAQKPVGGKAWSCVHGSDTLYAGYPHLYWEQAQAARFVRRCTEFRRGQKC